MIPLYLFISDFLSHQASEIDFTSFSSALVIGKMDNSDLISNGVGKTSIFRAIEYCLFNQVRDPLLQKDIVLERLIRDEAQKVSVVFDFSIDNEIYRISRSRTRKGISDLSLYKAQAETKSSLLHTLETNKAVWENISSRRSGDTEADVAKLIRSNHKSFCNTNYFMQGDLSGIAMATPEKRKVILKDALELAIYSKLEELAKDKANSLIKEIDKSKAVLASIGNPMVDIEMLNKELVLSRSNQFSQKEILALKEKTIFTITEQHNQLAAQCSILEAKSSAIVAKHSALSTDVSKLTNSIVEYKHKRKSVVALAKQLTFDLDEAKKVKVQLGEAQLDKVALLKEELTKLTQESNTIKTAQAINSKAMQECLIPLPADGTCKHCRQPLTIEHRKTCSDEMENKKATLAIEKKDLDFSLKALMDKAEIKFNECRELEKQAKQIESNNLALISKEKSLQDNRKLYEEYNLLLTRFEADLLQKQAELMVAEKEVFSSSAQETTELKKQIADTKEQMNIAQLEVNAISRSLANLQSQIAVIEHSIQQKTIQLAKKAELEQAIFSFEEEYTIYPSVIQAFGSTGIPNLIIQNVLQDLQDEANSLLTQIRPGLQLGFSTEKTRSDGALADTLDISYFLNNKIRDYSQLSGAQRLCIAFSLKLGLSFLLAKMMGSQIKFLLLDEIDQSLDKAGIDALTEIVKAFSTSFKILVITHSDRLQAKFNTAILVEQDQSMISRARVVSSW